MEGVGGEAEVSNNGCHEATGNIFWNWETDIYCNENPFPEMTPLRWDDINQTEDDSILYLLGSQTPARDCEVFGYGAPPVGDDSTKGGEISEPQISSAPKRRRMLQFPSSPNKSDLGNNTPETSVTTSVVLDCSSRDSTSFSQSLSLESLPIHKFADQFSGGCWQKDISEVATPYSSFDTSCSRSSNVSSVDQNVSGFCDSPLEVESQVVRETTKLSSLKIFRGQKTTLKAAEKAKTTVALPFTLIKPCGAHKGAATLKDINLQVNTPPKKEKPAKNQDRIEYPPSALTGKPVTSKTTIPTRGGKGSITIVRTKG